MFPLTLCSCLWFGPDQRAPYGMNEQCLGPASGLVTTASWHPARLGLLSVLPNDPGPLQLVELFKYCTLLVNRHNILKVSQSNIYAARKTFYMIFKQPCHLFIFILWSFCFVSESENLAYLPRSKYYDENIGRLKSRLSKVQKDFFLSVNCTTALHGNKLINLFGMLEAWKLIFHG